MIGNKHKKNSILVLGGARFHGKLIVEKLVNLGHQVFVLNRGRYTKEYENGIIHLKADRNDEHLMKMVLRDYYFDVIIDNNGYNENQVQILKSAIGERFGHYIFSSTVAVYQKLTVDKPLKENSICEPNGTFSPKIVNYAQNKLHAENYIKKNFTEKNFTILRISNIFGNFDFAGKLSYFYFRFKDNNVILLESEINNFSLINVNDVSNIIILFSGNKNVFGKILNIADPTSYNYQIFFNSVYQPFFSQKIDLFLYPAIKIWKKNYFLPFAWGPELDVSSALNFLQGYSFSHLSEWGPSSLEWELKNLQSIQLDKEYISQIKIEKTLIKEFEKENGFDN